MPTAVSIPQKLLRDVEAVTVYTREQWSDEWAEQPHLWADYCNWVANPSISTAGFTWVYGELMRTDEIEFGDVEPLDVVRHWVKISIALSDDADGNARDPLCWYGRIEEVAENQEGAAIREEAGAETRVARGMQKLVAYGLELVLTRQQVLTCWYLFDTDWEKQLGRAITFNEPNQKLDAGNRTMDPGPQGTYIFAGDLSDAADCTAWTTRNVVEYLARYHTPVDDDGNNTLQFSVEADGADLLPDNDKPVVRAHGRTLKDLLDELMNRRRALGYTLEVDEGASELGHDLVVIRPFTFADNDVLDDDNNVLLQANPDQKTIDYDKNPDVDPAQLKFSAGQVYDQVIARGDRILCVGTFSVYDDTLEAGWTAAEQTEYNAGASGEPDYPAVDEVAKRAQRNADYRSQEHLRRVYRYFDVPPEWDEKVTDGRGGAANHLFPYDEFVDLVPDLWDAAFYAPHLKFERYLPLKTDHDYSAADLTPDAVVDNTPAGKAWEYRRPYVLLELQDEIAEADKYHEVEQLASCAEVEFTGDGEGRKFCCSVRVQEDNLGIVVHVQGAPQYVIAANDFVRPDASDALGSTFDWADMILTAAIRSDRCVEMKHPNPIVEDEDVLRILVIDARERAQMHYVAPGTVVGLLDGDLVATSGGGLVRDDRDWLDQLARVAYQWYGTQRQALTLGYRQVIGPDALTIGDLIVTVGSGETEQDVRSVVTEIRVDFAQTENDVHRTMIHTQWAELDALALL